MDLLDVLQSINWIDIFVLIILLRICYIALKTGIPVESFKLAGTIVATYVSLHYYKILAGFIRHRVPIEDISLSFFDFIAFFLLGLTVYIIFVLLRVLCYNFMKLEAASSLNKWGGFVLGVARGFLLISLLTFLLVVSGVGYLQSSVKHSFFAKRFFSIAPAAYSYLWDGLVSKFASKEKFNTAVFEVQKELNL